MSTELLSTPEPPTISVLEEIALEPDRDVPAPSGPRGITFEEIFKAFAKFGDPKSDGKMIGLSNSDKWMKQARVIDNKRITTNDTCIYFKKLKLPKLNINHYVTFLEDLAKNKNMEFEEMLRKMTICGKPGHQPPSNILNSVFVVNRPAPIVDYSPPTVDITPSSKAPTAGNKSPATGSKTPTSGNKTPTTGNKTPTTGNKTPTTGNKAPVVNKTTIAVERPSTSQDEPTNTSKHKKRGV